MLAEPLLAQEKGADPATPCRSARAVHDRSCPNYSGFRRSAPATESTASGSKQPADLTTPFKAGRTLQHGVASWYGPGFHGRLTANGERFDMNAMTAAHKTLPFGTQVLVHNKRNGRQVLVRINDRGPFVKGRVIDLSKAAAQHLGMVNRGHDQVVLHEAVNRSA